MSESVQLKHRLRITDEPCFKKWHNPSYNEKFVSTFNVDEFINKEKKDDDFNLILGLGHGEGFRAINLNQDSPISIFIEKDGVTASIQIPNDLFADNIIEMIRTPQKQS